MRKETDQWKQRVRKLFLLEMKICANAKAKMLLKNIWKHGKITMKATVKSYLESGEVNSRAVGTVGTPVVICCFIEKVSDELDKEVKAGYEEFKLSTRLMTTSEPCYFSDV